VAARETHRGGPGKPVGIPNSEQSHGVMLRECGCPIGPA
jgi:hypothetical protein